MNNPEPHSITSILYAQKIVDIDWYLCEPLKEYDPSYCYLSNSSIKKVPVLRIFGPTPTGQSTCLHIHGVFPYLYIPLPAGVDPSPYWIGELSKSIDFAINKGLATTNSTSLHVYDIKIITAKPFYGYHPTKRLFLQIFLYNPLHVRMLADILLTGAVMKTPLQPHEAHVPFPLQFMIDYNLYGMSLIYLAEMQFRFSPDDAEELNYSQCDNHNSTFSNRVWTLSTLPQGMLHSEARHSNCDLEVDTHYHSILNPSLFSSSENPGLAVLWEDERQRRKQGGLSPNITLPLEVERKVESSSGELQLLAQFEAVLHERLEKHREGNYFLPICSLSTSQLPEKEDANTSLLLSLPSLIAAGDNKIISLLTELDMGTESENGRQLNVDGHLIVVPPKQMFSTSESMVNETLSKSVGSEFEPSLKISALVNNATNSFNLALIKDGFIAASILLLPQERQGNILSYETALETELNSSFLDNMIFESFHLSQPYLLNIDVMTTKEQPSYTPPSQLDGNGSRGRKKSHSKSDKKYSVTKSRLIRTISNSASTQKNYLDAESTNLSPATFTLPATNEHPLCVSIPRESLGFKYNLPTNLTLPFRKHPILNITRLDISNPSFRHHSISNQLKVIQDDNCLSDGVSSNIHSSTIVSFSKSPHFVDYYEAETPVLSPSHSIVSSEMLLKSDINLPIGDKTQLMDEEVSATEIVSSVYHTPPVDVVQSIIEINQVNRVQIGAMLDRLPEITTPTFNKSLIEATLDAVVSDTAVIQYSSSIPVNQKCTNNFDQNFSVPICPENLLTLNENQLIVLNTVKGEEHVLGVPINSSHSNSLVSSDEFSNDYMSPNEQLSGGEAKEIYHSPNFDDSFSEVNNYCEIQSNTKPTQSHIVCSPASELPDELATKPDFLRSSEHEYDGKLTDQQLLTNSDKSNLDCTHFQANEFDIINPTAQHATTHQQVQRSSKLTELEPSDYHLSVSPISENSEHLAAYQVSLSNSPLNSPASSSGLLSSHSTQSPSNSIVNDSSVDCIPGDNVIPSKSGNKYSSVSSESESDNYEYQLSNSLLEKQVRVGVNLEQSSIDTKFISNDKTDIASPEEKVHSTPFKCQTSSPKEINSQGKHSPILNEKYPKSYTSQSPPEQVRDIPLITSDLLAQINEFSDVTLSIQNISQNFPKTSYQNSTENIAYELLIASQTKIEPNLSYYYEGPSLANLYNFKLSSQELLNITTTESRVCQFLTIMSVEILVRTRCELFPDPQYDSLLAICYYVSTYEYHSQDVIYISGIISLSDTWDIEDLKKSDSLALTNLDDIMMTYTITEIDLFQEFISKVLEFDPDICLGYEYQRLSWGYLIERACMLDIDLPFCLSRAQPPGINPRDNLGEKPYCYNYSDPHIIGRVLINLWRICKHELTLTGYTFENVAYHTLHQRYTHFSNDILTKWYTVFPSRNRWRPLQYYMLRAQANIRITESLDIVGRTSELARLFGIEFYNVLARGTQYRVESMMIRLLKRHEYITVSPSVRQRSKMSAPSVIPLVMEPRRIYFTDPVVVLDFQALYPSIVIAYNYCYSTCLGKLKYLPKDGLFPFGAIELEIPAHILGNLKSSDVTISPNGVVFVKPHIRKGMLPIMLEEILKTRIMVKQALKKNKHDAFIQKILNARQLGLKNIANVTFGYTQANFSGRMPCVDLGDSIVAKARETLELAITFVNHSSEWNGEVIYGDTDSLFIQLPGRSREESFKIGYEITKKVTQMNPEPIELKFEKVYQPCLLMAKKRYVGFYYKTSDQTEPKFDAKGIEIVRRDTCPIVAKILEHSLKLFFRTNEIDQVRRYVIEQCTRLFTENVSVQELTFAREFRGLCGYQPGLTIPSLHIIKKKMLNDPRSEPRIGSRVPFVCVYTNPDSLLIDLVRTPEQVLADSSLHIHAHYYLYTHIIPSLERAFDRAGANVRSWICALPRLFRPSHYDILNPIEKRVLSNFIDIQFCAICDEEGDTGLCQQCATDPERKHTLIGKRFQVANQRVNSIIYLCRSCQGDSWAKHCVSTDCPVLYKRFKLTEELSYAKRLSDLYLSHYFDLSF